MTSCRINCRVADIYFELCHMDNDIPTFEGLKEFARVCRHE